jgi:hypothetical protein
MSVDPVTPEATERAIRTAADKLIQAAAVKHGLSIDEIPPSARDEAYAYARQTVESDQRNQNNEYYLLWEQQKQENALLKTQLGAVRDNKAAAVDNRVVPTLEMTRDRMGRSTWAQLNTNQRIAAIGVQPDSVDRPQLAKLFGRNADHVYASDLMKTSPYRYRQLREVAKILDVTGK